MREKWETLSLAVLKDIAKGIGVKGYSTMKKDELITILDEKEAQAGKQKAQAEETAEKEPKKPAEKAAEKDNKNEADKASELEDSELDSKITACGILEIMPDGYGFIRCENYLPGEHDVYVAPGQIRKFGMKTGDIIEGNTKVKTASEKFSALLYVKKI